jgi:hypothetical protein
MDNTKIQNDGLKSNTFSQVNKTKKKHKLSLTKLTAKQREALLSGGYGLAGIVTGAGSFALMSYKNDEIPQAILDTETTAEEPLIVESTVPIILYTDAPVANGVTNDMSFSEAFATARKEVGAGGIFEWNGQVYNTYYKTEWDAMSESDKQDYIASIDNATQTIRDGDTVLDENIANQETDISDPNDIQSQNTSEDVYIEVLEVADINEDGKNDVFLVDADGNTMPDLVIDRDLDGDADLVILDVDIENGLTGNEIVVEIEPINADDMIEGFVKVEPNIDKDIEVSIDDKDENDVDDFDPTIDDYDIADNSFDNDLDMDDYAE